VRVATWNVNGLRARQGLLAHWLAARQPDVVALQELKLTDDQFPRDELEALGYRAAVHGEKSWNGVAILARKPLEEVQAGLPGLGSRRAPDHRAHRGRVGDERVLPEREVGLAPRLSAQARVLRRARGALGGEPSTRRARAALCGDFNLCPAALDSWNEPAFAGTIFHTEEERTRFQRAARGRARRPVSRAQPRAAGVHVVGLSRRRVPQARGAAHRPRARHAARCSTA
jgi:exodeoxyribonuclease-3